MKRDERLIPEWDARLVIDGRHVNAGPMFYWHKDRGKTHFIMCPVCHRVTSATHDRIVAEGVCVLHEDACPTQFGSVFSSTPQ